MGPTAHSLLCSPRVMSKILLTSLAFVALVVGEELDSDRGKRSFQLWGGDDSNSGGGGEWSADPWNSDGGHYPFNLHHIPQYSEVTKTIPVHKTLRIPVPHPVPHPIKVPVPVQIPEPVHIKIPYPVTVEKRVEVPVEKVVHYPVEKPVPYKVIKEVPYPVEKPYPVPVPVYKTKYVYHSIKKYVGKPWD